jgi:hypothetical protein
MISSHVLHLLVPSHLKLGSGIDSPPLCCASSPYKTKQSPSFASNALLAESSLLPAVSATQALATRLKRLSALNACLKAYHDNQFGFKI